MKDQRVANLVLSSQEDLHAFAATHWITVDLF